MRLVRAIFLLLFCVVAFAKEAKQLTLADAISVALLKNSAVAISSLQRVIDKFTLQLSHDKFMPQYSLNASAGGSSLYNGVYAIDGNGSLKTLYGSDIKLSYNAVKNFAKLEGGVNNLDHVARLSFEQPFLRNSSYNVNHIVLDNANDYDYLNRLAYQDAVSTVINNVQQQYFKVIKTIKQQQIILLELKRAKDTLAEYELKVTAGSLPKASITQQQAQIVSEELHLEENKTSITSDYRDLMVLLGVDVSSGFELVSDLSEFKVTLPKLQDAIAYAKKGNYSYQQHKISLRVAERAYESALDNSQPSLNAAASIDTNGDKTIALKASIPLDDMSLKSDILSADIAVKKAKILLTKAELDLANETSNMLNSLLSQLQQIKLATLRQSLAKQNYDSALYSQMHGNASSYEVVAQMQAYLQSQMALIDHKINLYTGYANFNRFLGISLDYWHVKLVM